MPDLRIDAGGRTELLARRTDGLLLHPMGRHRPLPARVRRDVIGRLAADLRSTRRIKFHRPLTFCRRTRTIAALEA